MMATNRGDCGMKTEPTDFEVYLEKRAIALGLANAEQRKPVRPRDAKATGSQWEAIKRIRKILADDMEDFDPEKYMREIRGG